MSWLLEFVLQVVFGDVFVENVERRRLERREWREVQALSGDALVDRVRIRWRVE